MMRFLLSTMLLAASTLFFAPAARSDEPAKKDQAPLFCEKGKQLAADDFAAGALSKDWHIAKGKWEVKDGVVRGDELKSDMHAAVLRHDLSTHNLIAEFSFRFDGGKGFSFGLNNKDGHVCRAKIMPTLMQVTKDKPNEKSTQKGAVLDTQILDLKPGEWHNAVVEIGGKTIVATIDGNVIAVGSHDGIDTDKTSFAFPVVGEGVSFKSVTVWDATPPTNPAAKLDIVEYRRALLKRIAEQTGEEKMIDAIKEIQNLDVALEKYRIDNGTYPAHLAALIEAPEKVNTWRGPYLRKGREGILDPWGHEYHFVHPGVHNPDSFDLWSEGDGKRPPEGISNWKAAAPASR